MSPLLLAALQVVVAMGGEVNDVKRLDVKGEMTKASITWPWDKGMTTYIQGFDPAGTEEVLAMEILKDAVKGDA